METTPTAPPAENAPPAEPSRAKKESSKARADKFLRKYFRRVEELIVTTPGDRWQTTLQKWTSDTAIAIDGMKIDFVVKPAILLQKEPMSEGFRSLSAAVDLSNSSKEDIVLSQTLGQLVESTATQAHIKRFLSSAARLVCEIESSIPALVREVSYPYVRDAYFYPSPQEENDANDVKNEKYFRNGVRALMSIISALLETWGIRALCLLHILIEGKGQLNIAGLVDIGRCGESLRRTVTEDWIQSFRTIEAPKWSISGIKLLCPVSILYRCGLSVAASHLIATAYWGIGD